MKKTLLSLVLVVAISNGASAAQSIGRGRPNLINGQATNWHPEVGYLVTVRTDGSAQACTATLIRRQTVISAAHCVDNYVSGYIYFRLPNGAMVSRNIYAQTRYPAYNFPFGDISLLLLDYPVYEINPAWLSSTFPRQGDRAGIVGYGRDQYGAYGVKRVGGVTLSACPGGNLTWDACWSHQPVDVCHGDSGGPVYVGYLLAGVVSGGYGCSFNLSFATAVSPFEWWIRSVLQSWGQW